MLHRTRARYVGLLTVMERAMGSFLTGQEHVSVSQPPASESIVRLVGHVRPNARDDSTTRHDCAKLRNRSAPLCR